VCFGSLETVELKKLEVSLRAAASKGASDSDVIGLPRQTQRRHSCAPRLGAFRVMSLGQGVLRRAFACRSDRARLPGHQHDASQAPRVRPGSLPSIWFARVARCGCCPTAAWWSSIVSRVPPPRRCSWATSDSHRSWVDGQNGVFTVEAIVWTNLAHSRGRRVPSRPG
jgi:hypothetical protein